MSEAVNPSKVLSMRLPLQGHTLLMPYAMVAEVVNLSLRPHEDSFLGEVEWRGVHIPVFSLERACNQTEDIIAGRVRLAVLYGVSDPAKRPYYALLLAGMPHTETVTPSTLIALDEADTHEACALLGVPAMLGDEIVFMPNIQELEAWMDRVEVH